MALARLCIHNGACDCTDKRCSVKCGWNPKGAEARKNDIQTKGLTEKADGTCRLVVKKGAAQ